MSVKQRKVLFWLAILFVIIWLSSDPESLAAFVQWLGRGIAGALAAFRAFVVAIVG